MTTTAEPRVTAAQNEHDKNPITFLIESGLLEPRGATADRLRDILKPCRLSVDGFNYTGFLEARKRIGESLGPGETLAQLIVEMREE